MERTYTAAQVFALLRKKLGGKRVTGRAIAEKLGVSHQYVSDMMRGHRPIGKTVLNFLGMKRVRTITIVYTVAGPDDKAVGNSVEVEVQVRRQQYIPNAKLPIEGRAL